LIIQCKAIVAEVYESKNNENVYYTFIDLGNGGQFKTAVKGKLEGVKPGSMLEVNGEFKSRIFQAGGIGLTYEGRGVIRHLDGTNSKDKEVNK
jgi:hypothetical protein